MKIAFSPITVNSNKYIDIILERLSFEGIETISLGKMFTGFSNFRQVKIVHFNWVENINGNSKIRKIISYLGKLIVFKTLKVFNKKIVWTMHNREPHSKDFESLQHKLMNKIIQISDMIIIHSEISRNLLVENYKIDDPTKIEYVPHPNYIGYYGFPKPTLKDAPSVNDKLHLTFFGAIKPYKNIELLIDAFKPYQNQAQLTIAGNPIDSLYKKQIEDYTNDINNIRLDLNFIPDNEILQYILNSDLLILPYDMASSLNSGTVILSFSYGRSVICPEIGTIKDIANKSCILTYDYSDEAEHLANLKDKIKEAIELKNKQPDVFLQWGKHMQKEVAFHNDNYYIGQYLASLYNDLIHYN